MPQITITLSAMGSKLYYKFQPCFPMCAHMHGSCKAKLQNNHIVGFASKHGEFFAIFASLGDTYPQSMLYLAQFNSFQRL